MAIEIFSLKIFPDKKIEDNTGDPYCFANEAQQ